MVVFPEKERIKWLGAANAKLNTLLQNGTWELVELPPDKKTVDCKWIFKVIYTSDGKPETYNARPVAKGYSQKYSEDFDATFVPVLQQSNIKFY